MGHNLLKCFRSRQRSQAGPAAAREAAPSAA
jgi:hypothetical protein